MRFNKSLLVLGLLAVGAFSAVYAGDISRSTTRTTPLHPIVNPATGLDVLYDQCTDTTEFSANAITSQNFEASFDAFDSEGADDFVVPTGETWTINEVIALGVYSLGGGPAASVNVTIWSDVGTLPGAVVYSAPSVVPTTDVGGSFVLDLSTPAVLTAGTYWLEVQVNMDFTPFLQWFWAQDLVLRNSGCAWRNIGGGFGVGCTSWERLSTCIPGFDPDFLFCLLGS